MDMPRKDINETAFAVVQQATGAVPAQSESAKALAGRKGDLVGGKARAESLTAAKRKTIVKNAAKARWWSPGQER